MKAYVECSQNQSKKLYLIDSETAMYFSPEYGKFFGTPCGQLFLQYVNRCPSVCVAKVILWHAFVSHLGMFLENRIAFFTQHLLSSKFGSFRKW